MATSSFINWDISFHHVVGADESERDQDVHRGPRVRQRRRRSPRLWITFSRSPRSKYYNPEYFNQLAQALAAEGRPHPSLVS
jgi:hypothetical protein